MPLVSVWPVDGRLCPVRPGRTLGTDRCETRPLLGRSVVKGQDWSSGERGHSVTPGGGIRGSPVSAPIPAVITLSCCGGNWHRTGGVGDPLSRLETRLRRGWRRWGVVPGDTEGVRKRNKERREAARDSERSHSSGQPAPRLAGGPLRIREGHSCSPPTRPGTGARAVHPSARFGCRLSPSCELRALGPPHSVRQPRGHSRAAFSLQPLARQGLFVKGGVGGVGGHPPE